MVNATLVNARGIEKTDEEYKDLYGPVYRGVLLALVSSFANTPDQDKLNRSAEVRYGSGGRKEKSRRLDCGSSQHVFAHCIRLREISLNCLFVRHNISLLYNAPDTLAFLLSRMG